MTLKLTPLAAALLALASPSLQAQTATDKRTESPGKLEQVLVTGIRASQEKSLTTKRNADTLVEVITAEDIGKMPDKNVADSLQRMPGVTTTSAGSAEGSFGENEHVQLRGLQSQYTLTTLNGHTVSTGDWYGPNIAHGGRSVTFTLLPAAIIGRAVVNKTAQADLIDGGLAGTVDIQTRKPFDFRESFTASAAIEGTYSTAAKKWNPDLSALVSWKSEDKSFGILGQVFSQKRDLQRAGSEGVWWDKFPNDFPLPDYRGKNVSLLTGAVLFQQHRDRTGGYVDAQWKPAASLELSASAFTSKMTAKNSNSNYMVSLVPAVLVDASMPNPGVTPAAYANCKATGNTVLNCTLSDPNLVTTVEDYGVRPDAKTSSNFFNLDGKYVLDNSLTLSGKVGRTEGKGRTSDIGLEVYSAAPKGGGYASGASNVLQLLVPDGGTFVFDPARTDLSGGWNSTIESVDKEDYGQFDAHWTLAGGVVTDIKAGARVTRHERSLLAQGGAMSADALTLGKGLDPKNAVGNNYPDGWGRSLPTDPTPGFTPWRFTEQSILDWNKKYAVYSKDEQKSNSISEKTAAAYVMADLSFSDGISGNVGMRAVRTQQTVASGLEPVVKQSNTQLLPSFNLRADLSKDLVGRLGIGRSMSRPDWGQLAGQELDNTSHSGTASNPTMKPTVATNLDGAVEWYFAPRSVLAIGAFYSDLKDLVSYVQDPARKFINSSSGKLESYKVTLPTNVKGHVAGLTLSYEQALFGGFGANASYNYTDGKQSTKLNGAGGSFKGTCDGSASEDCSLYGTSRNSYNLGIYYENDVLSARLAYAYRDTYKLGSFKGDDYFQKGFGTLNFALNYTVNKQLQLSLEAQNLTDPLLTTYHTADFSQIQGVYRNGRVYYAGLRYRY